MGKASNTGANQHLFICGSKNDWKGRRGRRRTAVHDAVDEREVHGDKHEDGLARKHLEGPEQRAVDDTPRAPVLPLVRREIVLRLGGVGLAFRLDLIYRISPESKIRRGTNLLEQEDWGVRLREGEDHEHSAGARKYHHDPEDPSPAERTFYDAESSTLQGLNSRQNLKLTSQLQWDP